MSYANVRMYYEVLPTYNSKNEKGSTEAVEKTDFKGMLSILKMKK